MARASTVPQRAVEAARRALQEALRPGSGVCRYTAEEQRANRERAAAASDAVKRRRADDRLKFRLGGLVVVSGLIAESRETTCGYLERMKSALDGEKGAELRARFEAAGRAQFDFWDDDDEVDERDRAKLAEIAARGGLVIRAGLAGENRRMLLGMMADGMAALAGPAGPRWRQLFEAAGHESLTRNNAGEGT